MATRLGVDWHEQVCRGTSVEYCNHDDSQPDSNIAITLDPKKAYQKVRLSSRQNVPRARQLLYNGLTDDELKYIAKTFSATNSREVSLDGEALCILVRYEEESEGFTDIEGLDYW